MKAAYEEAEHAAKFFELLGEVLAETAQRKNLQLSVLRNGATAE